MTLLVAWIGVDDKKIGKSISSMYFASDSRYSWPNSSKYDFGIKVFGSTIYPEIFGFYGDVLFPSIIFGQLIPQIDNGLLFKINDNGNEKNNKLLNFIRSSLESYPKNVLLGSFTILYGTRIYKEFKLYEISYTRKFGLTNKEIELPKISTKVFSGGSGEKEFTNNWETWENVNHNNYRTSRSVYHCLSKTLKEMKDIHTGGMPQIVGLYRNKNSRLFGIIQNNKKYVYGKESSVDTQSDRIEWRNENFERMDPKTLKILRDAQIQPIQRSNSLTLHNLLRYYWGGRGG